MSSPRPRETSSAELGREDSQAGITDELRLPGMLLGAVLVLIAFGLLALGLTAATGNRSPEDYNGWLAAIPNSLLTHAQWVLGDITEPQFYKSPTAAVGLLAGATLAWWLGRRGTRWAGHPISYGSGLWPWVLGAASLSLILSNLAFGWRLATGWQPTFVPFVCVATAITLVYGRGWANLATGAVLGAATTTPVAMLLIATVTGPLGLPAVVSNTAAMSVGTVISFLACRLLPWMWPPITAQTPTPTPAPRGVLADAIWTVRRVVTDFTETQFFANELASIGVIAGVSIAVLADPSFPAYGSELIPQILFAQALTSAVGILAWRRHYRAGGWAPTYISVVSVAPATVLASHGSPIAIAVGAVAGALLCPAIARPISARLPPDFHPFIGNTIAMALGTTIVVPLVTLLPGTH
jgi:hypothetical protein